MGWVTPMDIDVTQDNSIGMTGRNQVRKESMSKKKVSNDVELKKLTPPNDIN